MLVDACDNIYITGYSTCNGTYKDVLTLKYSNLAASITPGGPTTFCQGGSVNLTASPASSYLWSNGATSSSITVSTSGNYSVTTTNAGGCSAASTAVLVNVVPLLPASVSIAANTNQPICPGQNVSFTATAMNGGTAPVYQWLVDNTPVGNDPNFSTTTLTNGAQVRCTMMSNATCPNPTTASSNVLPIAVNPTQITSVTISASSDTICSGQNVSFTPTPTNGGTAPTYQWYVNNSLVGNGSVFSTTSLTNGAQVYCAMTSNATCASPQTMHSDTLSVTVNPILTPSVSISGPAVVCMGQDATFTANPTQGGTMPAFQWFVNNNMVGTGAVFSTSTLTNGAQVYCIMMPNSDCAMPSSATSPIITITVLAPPNTQISTNGNPTSFCMGGSVTLTASPTGTYFWSNGATSKSITVTTSGVYTVKVTVSNGCSAVSAPTTITVHPLPQTPSIFPPGPINLCQGEEVLLTSNFANGYTWSNGATTQSITVLSSGNYSVIVSDINECTASSSPVSVSVHPTVQPAIELSCDGMGNDAMVTAIPVNGGSNPTYKWWINDTLQNETSPVLPIINGLSAWVIKCQMTSNATCAPDPPISDLKAIMLGPCVVPTNEAAIPEGFKVFPNPSTGQFVVEFFLPGAKTVSHQVQNVLGQVVWKSDSKVTLGDYSFEINLGRNIIPGIYLLTTDLGDEVLMAKIEIR
jgi:hypothetical protein